MNFKLYLILSLFLPSLVVKAEDIEKKEKFEFKVFKNEKECLEYLKKKQKLYIPEQFHSLFGIKDFDLVEKLENGNPNATMKAISPYELNGYSLLHCLVIGNGSPKSIEAIKFLLYKGANINIKNGHGDTPLDRLIHRVLMYCSAVARGVTLAGEFNFDEVIKCLLENGVQYSDSSEPKIEEVYSVLECDQSLKSWSWPFRNEQKYKMCNQLKNIRKMFKEQALKDAKS